MKTPMEHYLDDLCAVLHFTRTNLQEPGCRVIGHRYLEKLNFKCI